MPNWTDEDRKVMEHLRFELSEIHYRWASVKELWVFKKDHLRIMHSYGVDFFSVIRRAQIDDLFIALARFTDVDKGGKNRTVNLADAVRRFLGPEELKHATEHLSAIWPKIKDQRDRVLAHSDYDTHVRGGAPVAGVIFAELMEFVDHITDIMRAVDKAYDGVEWVYEERIRNGSWTLIFEGLLDAEYLRSLQSAVNAGIKITPPELFRAPTPPT